jgi:4'-phosphopantetheinyl transferase
MIDVQLIRSLDCLADRDASCLAPAERARHGAFHRPADAANFLAGRRLVRQRLGRVHGLAPAQVPLEIDANGRPSCRLPGSPAFSISHAGGFVAVAWNAPGQGPVGVDIQPLDTPMDAVLEPHYLSSFEQQQLALHPEATRASERLRYFVLKEAILKCHGTGFRVPPESITLQRREPDHWTCTDGLVRGWHARLQLLMPPTAPQPFLTAVSWSLNQPTTEAYFRML